MKEYDEVDLDEIFYGEPPEISQFHNTLNKILLNIENVLKVPIENRAFA